MPIGFPVRPGGPTDDDDDLAKIIGPPQPEPARAGGFPNVPNLDEVATIVVNERRFDDWETVWVQHRWAEAYPLFRFTAVERDPIPEWWGRLQFKPGDECAIYLGGILAVTGVITVRQTSYDANQHGVMLQGKGITWYAARGSILDKDGKYDGMTFEQVARKVIAPFGIGVETIGKLNAIPFERLQLEPGKNLWDFLEGLARPRGIVMGSDHLGNLLLIDHHSFRVSAQLIEGHNILQCQATIANENIFSDYVVRGSTGGSDNKKGTDASEQEAHVGGTAKRYSPLLTLAEQPVWNVAELGDRAKAEYTWNQGTEVTATVTVQGWKIVPGGRLWRAGEKVMFHSPMAMISMPMKIQTLTFTQDRNSGTLTTIELVAPWLLKDSYDAQVGMPPGPGKANTAVGPASTPDPGIVGPPPPLNI
jgi:prophage tail gpP-like protein